jgi:hypothetical protein
MADNEIIDEVEGLPLDKIIEGQLQVITTVCDIDPQLYDDAQADTIKTITNAHKVIQKAQLRLLKSI